MLYPKELETTEAGARGVQPGWWAVTQDGTPLAGPYPTREAAIVGIAKRGETQPTGRPGEQGPAPE
ncbi:hypothetical protein V5F77_18840 [Xanthobacter sp. DSM 24535]|uniref:hypothetical protein n=1 Tax=Roseixanthobacter psychrophilus TaxID=3119917 RepID=UPI003727EF29